MNSVKPTLPHQNNRLYLTDGGLETTLIYHEGCELPSFAAFVLLEHAEGRERLRAYFRRYLDIARDSGRGFVLESPTWRSNPEWGARLGYNPKALDRINRDAIALMAELRDEYAGVVEPIVISGCLGPRGDGYDPARVMTIDEAADYHRPQLESFDAGAADLATAITMTNMPEAGGIARAARELGLPCVISFTLETDGRLPTGQPLGQAIAEVDALTDAAPAYYMINCAHPEHFRDAIAADADWLARIHGLRANASRRSHAELDASTELDAGNPAELGQDYRALRKRLSSLNVLGGCCGTDHRHVAEIAAAWPA